MPYKTGIGDIVVLSNYLEQCNIPNREFLAVCICKKYQHAIIGNCYSIDGVSSNIKELMGMKVKVVQEQKDCLLCHIKQ